MSFKLLKKQSEDKNRLDKLVTALENKNKTYDTDTNYWSLTRDKDGAGTAIIRFLPVSQNDGDLTLPFVEMYSHRFKGKTGKWYIENCRTTIGEDDPCADYNTKLWNTGDEQLQAFVRQYSKRKLQYIANILVVVDPAKPENEGKVFKFSFGRRIMDKISAAMKGNPALKKKGFEPYCFWKGADFALVATKVDDQVNYNDSSFEPQSQIHYSDDKPLTDAQIEDVYNKQFTLKDEIAPDKFKSYEVLQKKLNAVLGIDSAESTVTTSEKKLAPAKANASTKKKVEPEVDEDTGSEDELDDSSFASSSEDVDKIFADLEIDL